MKWEYKVVHSVFQFDVEMDLNVLGNIGWELIAIVNGVAILKRPIKQ